MKKDKNFDEEGEGKTNVTAKKHSQAAGRDLHIGTSARESELEKENRTSSSSSSKPSRRSSSRWRPATDLDPDREGHHKRYNKKIEYIYAES